MRWWHRKTHTEIRGTANIEPAQYLLLQTNSPSWAMSYVCYPNAFPVVYYTVPPKLATPLQIS